MQRRVIDLSDDEVSDVSLSSSAYDMDNSGVADAGYENVVAGTKTEQAAAVMDGYEGYVLSGALKSGDDSSSDSEGDLHEASKRSASGDVLSVGSGSLLSVAQVRTAVQRGHEFSQQLSDAKKRREKETGQEHLERALSLVHTTAEEATRKYSLVLELVRNRLQEIAKQEPNKKSVAIGNNNNNNNDDAVAQLSNLMTDVKQRLHKQLAAANLEQLRSQIPALVSGAKTEGLVAAERILRHELKTSATRRNGWNERFQTLLDLAEETSEEKLYKYVALKNVAQDFTFAAELVAKLIVNELSLPDPLKTVKAARTFGGHAGAQFGLN